MERPTITIEGEKFELKKLTGRSWRVFSEFVENQPEYTKADFIERQAEFIANFYDVTAEEILDKMPLEEIMPASLAVRNYVMAALTAKFAKMEKNVAADEAQ